MALVNHVLLKEAPELVYRISDFQGNLKVEGSGSTIKFGLKLMMIMKKFDIYKNVKPQ